MTIEEMIIKLPHLTYEKKITDDWGYTPNIYHFDGQWHCCWHHCEDCDALFGFTGETPVEAVTKAYNWCKENNLLK